MAGYLKEHYFAGALGAAGAEVVRQHVTNHKPLSPEKLAEVRRRVRDLQERAGYGGDYRAWIAKVTPPDLE